MKKEVGMIFILTLMAFLITACTSHAGVTGNTVNTQKSGVNNMSEEVVQKNDVVSVDYTGKLENGTVFDSSEGRSPLTFTAGEGQVIKGFDDAVLGMKVGDEKNVTIPPQEAYGERNESLIQTVPKSAFGDNADKLQEGMQIGITNPQNGQQFPATVTKIEGDNVTLDMNPPLAGKTLIFDIKVVKIEPPQNSGSSTGSQ